MPTRGVHMRSAQAPPCSRWELQAWMLGLSDAETAFSHTGVWALVGRGGRRSAGAQQGLRQLQTIYRTRCAFNEGAGNWSPAAAAASAACDADGGTPLAASQADPAAV